MVSDFNAIAWTIDPLGDLLTGVLQLHGTIANFQGFRYTSKWFLF